MTKGLILGKFMPPHAGHLALVDFARQRCDHLTVLVCAQDALEPIPGHLRLDWVRQALADHPGVEVVYTDAALPHTSVSSQAVSRQWADYLRQQPYGDFDSFFSSEPYGAFVAESLGIRHVDFDLARALVPVSATAIRTNPLAHWELILPAARPYFVKKVCLCGTESTGKSTLAMRLAAHFNTTYVPETARDIVAVTEQCTPDDLPRIAEAHARAVVAATAHANCLLFCDTGLATTRVYAQYLFGQELPVPNWVEAANVYDLYLLLEADAPYVQDGTRLPRPRRDAMQPWHRRYLNARQLPYAVITGSDWDTRFAQACAVVTARFGVAGKD